MVGKVMEFSKKLPWAAFVLMWHLSWCEWDGFCALRGLRHIDVAVVDCCDVGVRKILLFSALGNTRVFSRFEDLVWLLSETRKYNTSILIQHRIWLTMRPCFCKSSTSNQIKFTELMDYMFKFFDMIGSCRASVYLFKLLFIFIVR